MTSHQIPCINKKSKTNWLISHTSQARNNTLMSMALEECEGACVSNKFRMLLLAEDILNSKFNYQTE